jgi:molybdate transport system substrate-binding protein
MSLRRTLCLLAIIAGVSACSTPAAAAGRPVELTVFAAASLKDALEALTIAYETAVPGTTLTVATDSSSTLRTQIEQGAPVDLFLSADEKNPKALVDAGLTDGPAVGFAGNTLTVIVPTDNPAGIESPADLAGPGVKVVAAGDDVPVAGYAGRAVEKLAALPGYPAEYARAYAGNIVSREQNVKAVVAKIELGEGDAAIVYATDARASKAVATVKIPDAANVPATYAGVVLAASTRHDEAQAFLDWLTGPTATAILAGFGFLSPP